MSLLNDIKKKGNILQKNDLDLLEARVLELKNLINVRITIYGLPKEKNDLTIKYLEELKSITKFLRHYSKVVNE